MEERKVRGGAINGYLAFVKKSWGEAGRAECLQALGIPLDAKFEEGLFYPNKILVNTLKWISTTHGMEKVRQAGKFAIMNQGFLSYLVRFLTMDQMLTKAEERFRETWKFGAVSVRREPKKATVSMKDFSDIEENCVAWVGAFEGMLEMTKTKGKVTKARCQLKGGESCLYVIEWQ
jgi:hypothetical protein